MKTTNKAKGTLFTTGSTKSNSNEAPRKEDLSSTDDNWQAYTLNESDCELLACATFLLKKVIAGKSLRPAQLVSVAKLLHILSGVPKVNPGHNISVSVKSPRSQYGEIETFLYWEVSVEDRGLYITTGGCFEQTSTGADSILNMRWMAVPNKLSVSEDYLSNLSIVPDIRLLSNLLKWIDFDRSMFEVVVIDRANLLLEDS